MKTVIIAVGGNALLRPDDTGSAKEQFKRAYETGEDILNVFEQYKVAITHGNGPQVGAILLQNENSKALVPPMPLDVCGAMSQGSIGYMLEQSFIDVLQQHRLKKDIVTILTRVLVNQDDPAFTNPTKPIGPFYTENEAAHLALTKKWKMMEDSGRGWRRVVPSPHPVEIIEKHAIRTLLDEGFVVISVGGGGIPVVRSDGALVGVEAVIDKDLAAATLGKDIKADMLFILTNVDSVYYNFGTPEQIALQTASVSTLQQYIKEGQFKPGSMLPKIQASIEFLKSGGEAVLITSPEKLAAAQEHDAGTWIYP